MEIDEVRSIKLDLGYGKYIKLLQTLSVKQTIGTQGALLCGPRREQFVVIPSSALQSDTELEARFYDVTESVGLDSSMFGTSMLEISPHGFEFKKPIEILMRHNLFVEGSSSKVTVLYSGGKPTDNYATPLCQFTSVNETGLANGMTMTLWEDFIHIQSPHICRFGLLCEGKSYIVVWALLFTLKTPHPEQLVVELFLTPRQPKDFEEFKSVCLPGPALELRCSKLLLISCKEREDLHITVEMPLNANGWKPMGHSDLRQSIPYKDIQKWVVDDQLHFNTSFGFTKDRMSNIDVFHFAPVFTLNRVRCILSPSNVQSTSHSVAIPIVGQQNNVPGYQFFR